MTACLSGKAVPAAIGTLLTNFHTRLYVIMLGSNPDGMLDRNCSACSHWDPFSHALIQDYQIVSDDVGLQP